MNMGKEALQKQILFSELRKQPAAPAPVSAPKPTPKSAAVKAKPQEVNKLQLPTKRGLAKMFFLGILTLGIYPLVWMHRFCARIGGELHRRGGEFTFGARDFWLWNVLGSLILVGPFVFTHRLLRAMNGINQDFNLNG